MPSSRRTFLKSLSRTALVLTLEDVLSLAILPAQQNTPQQSGMSRPTYDAKPKPAPKTLPSPVTGTPLGYTFLDVAKESGLNAKTVYGGEHKNRFLLETTGCGVAFYDFDHDDWLDLFLVNGTRLEGFSKGEEPISRLFKNNRDGTFTDITAKSGMTRSGWGQGCCVGDYDNDGLDDLFVSYYGQNILYQEQRRRHLHRCHRQGWPHADQNPLELRLRLPRLRSRRPPRPLRRQLHRLRHQDRSIPRGRRLRLQRHPGRLRAARPRTAARTSSTATTATAPSPTSARKPACGTPSAPTVYL